MPTSRVVSESPGPVESGDTADAPKRSRSVTRERLLDAAAQVFAEQGVAGASVEEVCERAGYTRGAFYSNFATKDELLVALLDREEGLLLDRLSAALDGALSQPDPLAAVAGRLFDLQPFGASKYALRAELTLLAVRDPDLAAPYLAARRSFRERFVPFLREGWPRRSSSSSCRPTTRWTPSRRCSTRASARRSFPATPTPETTWRPGCCRSCSVR
ncbi:MAG: TetR/AcrR family transcriptional regulator [Actinomycetales bacterium]|nr:TetR/AcrR family transcriptional regulator [Candidatus Phosphoribacter baldrii]